MHGCFCISCKLFQLASCLDNLKCSLWVHCKFFSVYYISSLLLKMMYIVKQCIKSQETALTFGVLNFSVKKTTAVNLLPNWCVLWLSFSNITALQDLLRLTINPHRWSSKGCMCIYITEWLHTCIHPVNPNLYQLAHTCPTICSSMTVLVFVTEFPAWKRTMCSAP